MTDTPKPKRGRPRGNVALVAADEGMFQKDELEALRKQALEEVSNDQKDEARRRLLAEYRADALRQTVPEEQLEDVPIGLPGHSDRIMIDGKIYMHGEVYSFTKKEADTVRDIMARAWEHEDEVGGANRDLYQRRPRGSRISPMDTGRSASSILRM